MVVSKSWIDIYDGLLIYKKKNLCQNQVFMSKNLFQYPFVSSLACFVLDVSRSAFTKKIQPCKGNFFLLRDQILLRPENMKIVSYRSRIAFVMCLNSSGFI
jgi:hypothetical protein